MEPTDEAALKASREWKSPFPYGEQDSWGNSIASLRLNLRLTPLERLIRADEAARSLFELKNALRKTP